MFSPDAFDSLRILSLAVLDMLGFIENDRVILNTTVEWGIALDQPITGNHQIGLRGRFKETTTIGTIERDHSEVGRKTRGFAKPIKDEAFGADNQAGLMLGTGCPRPKISQCLKGFPEAHLIGENPRETIFTKEMHPPHSLLLIGPQDFLKIPQWRNLNIHQP